MTNVQYLALLERTASILERVYVFIFFGLAIGVPAALFLWLLIWHPVWLGVAAFVIVCAALWLGLSWAANT
jgi:hypothetical protein